jgi:GT2 family glycosyltransferase
MLRSGFFDTALEVARSRPDIGIFAPRLEDEDGTAQISTFRFASPLSEFVRAAETGPVTRLLSRYDVALPLDAPEAHIEWVSFACAMLRGSMVEQIGPMDEGYFLYFEDAEYCLRARRAGWRIIPVTRARAIHFRGGSGPVKALQKSKKRLPSYFYASRSRFLYQAYGQVGLILANLLWYSGRGVAQCRRLLGKPVPKVYEEEMFDLWINALQPLGPRLAPDELEGNVR